MNTSSTVPGHMVISVLRTNRVLKLIRFSAPMLREEASVNSCGDGWGSTEVRRRGTERIRPGARRCSVKEEVEAIAGGSVRYEAELRQDRASCWQGRAGQVVVVKRGEVRPRGGDERTLEKKKINQLIFI